MRTRSSMSAGDYGDIAFVANSTRQQVYDWYAQQERSWSYITWTIERPYSQHIVDYLAYRRADSLLDLALAKYGSTVPVLARVYRRACLSVRVAVCANPAITTGCYHPIRSIFSPIGRDLVKTILQTGTDAEVLALASCDGHADWLYELLLRCSPFGEEEPSQQEVEVSEARFELILRGLARNARMKTPRHETTRDQYRDGFSDYEYSKPFHLAWNLLEQLPPTVRWADWLETLYRELPRGHLKVEEVEVLLEKWVHPQPEAETEVDKDNRYTWDSFENVRASLIARHLTPEKAWAQASDRAYQQAFLEHFDPTKHSKIDPFDLGVDNVNTFDRLMRSKKAWATPEGRLLLQDAARAAEGLELNWATKMYEEREEKERKSNRLWLAFDNGREVGRRAVEDPPATSSEMSRLGQEVKILKRQQGRLLVALIVTAVVIGVLSNLT